MIIVSANGDGDFTTISDALASLEKLPANEPVTIYIKPGTYKERLEIARPYLTLKGDDANTTIITYDNYAFMPMEDGMKRGTFRSYSVFIDTHDFTAENITFENSSGDGSVVGQAIALYAEGDMLTFKGCRLLGNQDTLFTGPLPPKELQPNGFIGPKQFAPRINGRQYYKDCYICGDIDYIFGSSTAYFENCEIFTIKKDRELGGYVTAPSTPEGQEYGYVFESCRFTSNCAPESTYLGRPWRIYAKAVFLNCFMDAHIRKEGFHDWNKEESHTTAYWAEYKSYGPGASSERESWVHMLNDEEAEHFTRKKVLGF